MTTAYPEVAKILEKYDVVIGIEVHCQLDTQSKIFSSSANSYGDAPNSNTDPICLGLPGALPVLNSACVDLALRLALAIGGQVQPVSTFARKHYFYPDLPKGYQITQYDKPISWGGEMTLPSTGKRIGIERIQLEEDAGKSIHVGGVSLIDYNRAGVGLIEVVSNPHMSSPEEASEYLRRLHSYVVNLGICDGNMERGSFRADANVSLKPKGRKELGQRCEIKNVNSFKYIEKAIAYEVVRQHEVLSAGGTIVMETRGYDSDKNITYGQRSKETAKDYRYFPEPDLPPLVICDQRLERVRRELPELPEARAARFEQQLGLPAYDAKIIAVSAVRSAYFEQLVAALKGKVDAKSLSNYFMTEVLRAVKQVYGDDEMAPIPIPLEHSVSLQSLVAEGRLSGRMAKEVFEDMMSSGKAPELIAQEKNLVQVSDDSKIQEICAQVIAQNPGPYAEYKAGKEKLFGFFVGQAMKISGGSLNPAKVNEALRKMLDHS